MIKVVCVEDPNPDYSEWIFQNSGFEDNTLPIKVGDIFDADGIYGEMTIWNKRQTHLYLWDFVELGAIPSKYFRTIDELRDEKIKEILK